MTLTIPDEVLRNTGLTEHELLVEIACRLYDGGLLEQPDAVRLCGVSRVEFWAALESRGLPWMRITDLDTDDELRIAAQQDN